MSDAGGGALGAITGLVGTFLNAQNAQDFNNLTQEQQQFLMNQLAKIEGIQTPTFNTNLPKPEQLALQQYMAPILAQATQVSVDPNDRANQMAALQKMQSLASGASNSELNAASYKAMQNAAQQQHSQDAAIEQQMAARGTLGSGQELAAKMQAAQNGANNSQAGMLDAARNNALERMQANNQYLQGMGSLRGQDYSQALANANIMNQFNMANTGLRNQVNQMNTNLTNQQRVYNTGNNNAYQQALIQLQNNAAQQKYQDELGKRAAASGQANTISQNAMNAGEKQIGLNANTQAGGMQAAGNLANSLYGAAKQYSNVGEPEVEQKPKAQEDEEGTSFDGT